MVRVAIKVGLPVAEQPPRRSRRAVFPHRAPLNGRAVESARRCSSVREVPLVVFTVGLFYYGWVGHAKGFPHLFEAGPIVAVALAPSIEYAEDDASAFTPETPQTV